MLSDWVMTVLHNIVAVISRGVVYIMYKGVVKIATSNNAVAIVNRYHISNNVPHCPAPDGLNPETMRLEISYQL